MGSSPIARSEFLRSNYLPGDVAKWQGKGLQNPHQGFKSPRRLKPQVEPGLAPAFSIFRQPARVCKTLIKGLPLRGTAQTPSSPLSSSRGRPRACLFLENWRHKGEFGVFLTSLARQGIFASYGGIVKVGRYSKGV